MDFVYPIASEEDLVDWINSNFLLNISQESFIKPTKDLVVNIYDKFLHDFGIVFNVPQLQAVTTENIVMNSNSFILVNLKKILSELLSSMGFYDFSFKDLTQPQRRRNQIIFSLLAGLWSHFFDLHGSWKTISAEKEMLSRAVNDCTKRLDKAKKSYEDKLMELSRIKETVPDPNELGELHVKCLGEKDRCTVLKVESEKKKREKILFKEMKAERIQQNALKKEEFGEIEEQLVKSPQKIFAETERKEKQRGETRAERQLLNNQNLEYHSQLADLKEKLDEVKKLTLKINEEFTAHLVIMKTNCSKGKIMEEENFNVDAKISQLDIQISKVREICESVVKQKLTVKKSQEQRLATLKGMITELEQTLSNLENERLTKGESERALESSLSQQVTKLKADYDEMNATFRMINENEIKEYVDTVETLVPKLSKIISRKSRKMAILKSNGI